MSRVNYELVTKDHTRAARLLLATVKGDRDAVAVILDEVLAEQERGAVNALIFALADFGVRVVSAVSGDRAQEQLEAALLSLLDENPK